MLGKATEFQSVSSKALRSMTKNSLDRIGLIRELTDRSYCVSATPEDYVTRLTMLNQNVELDPVRGVNKMFHSTINSRQNQV